MSSSTTISLAMYNVASTISSMANLAIEQTPNHVVVDNTLLLSKINLFIYDSHTYHHSMSSSTRLAEAEKSPNYLGLPYFTSSDVEHLNAMEIKHGETLGDKFKFVMRTGKQRHYEMTDVRVFAHHDPHDNAAQDLSTIREKMFNINGNTITLNSNICDAVIECGDKIKIERPAKRIIVPSHRLLLSRQKRSGAGPVRVAETRQRTRGSFLAENLLKVDSDALVEVLEKLRL